RLDAGHLSNREDAFKKVSRLLKQGGTLNLLDIGFNNKSDMDDAKEKYREEWDDSEQYPFEYELRQYAEDAGLTVDKIDYPSGLHINLIARSEEHTSELQSRFEIVCRLLL